MQTFTCTPKPSGKELGFPIKKSPPDGVAKCKKVGGVRWHANLHPTMPSSQLGAVTYFSPPMP